MTPPIYVIKVGSSTLMSESSVFNEIKKVVENGNLVIVVAGGGEAVKAKYKSLNREIPYLTLKNGGQFRYCSPIEMPYIISAYDEIVTPILKEKLTSEGINPYVSIAGRNNLILGKKTPPLKVLQNGKELIIRDSLIGSVKNIDKELLINLLLARRVVCLMPPIADSDSQQLLNIDADILAAAISVELGAHHLRFVTGTAGILEHIANQESTIQDVYLEDELPSVTGRMRQKIRAAKFAVEFGIGDVAVTGPNSMSLDGKSTRFWPNRTQDSNLQLLNQISSINSVSRDERELAYFLKNKANAVGLNAEVDAAGNFVAKKGNGPVKLLMLGHIDTVPYVWKPQWKNAALSARGVVDAKGCIANFLESAIKVDVPKWGQLIVVGATEEEISSSKGAFYIRDNCSANAVIIGEPSGTASLTLGYYGLFKLAIRIKCKAGHTAGKEVVSAPDLFIKTISDLRAAIESLNPNGLSSLIKFNSHFDTKFTFAHGVLNCRLAPHVNVNDLITKVNEFNNDEVQIQILRATPGYQSTRTNDLVKAFNRAFLRNGLTPRYVVKKGSSDMNTLATTWSHIPMIAYGPGDSSLDHTDQENLSATDYLQSREILTVAITEWFQQKGTLYSTEGNSL